MRLVFENLTEEQAACLASWFEGQGEQDCVDWFENQGVKSPVVDVGLGKRKWWRTEGTDLIIAMTTL